jgi:hypothetical protein
MVTQKQIDAWRTVVEDIRAHGSISIMQMFHCGRMAWPEVNPAERSIAPSCMAPKQKNPLTGEAYPLPEEQTITLRGRNLITGLPDSVEVSSVEIREALSDAVQVLVDAVRDTLDETPPELIADLMEGGIALAGGGGLLQGLAERLSEETKMRVYIADDPLTCVARGAGKVLESYDKFARVLTSLQRGSTNHR